MPREMKAGETDAVRRRVYFQLVLDSDGKSPATAEAGGQPQVSVSGGAWSDTGIGALVAIGEGRYYATLDIASLASAGDWIETRYKSALTCECPGDSVFVKSSDPATVEGDIKEKTNLISNGTEITVLPSAAVGVTVSIVPGDDYDAAEGRRVTWSSSGWPNLTGAAISLHGRRGETLSAAIGTGATISTGGATQSVGASLTGTESTELLLYPGYRLLATMTNGHVVSLVPYGVWNRGH